MNAIANSDRKQVIGLAAKIAKATGVAKTEAARLALKEFYKLGKGDGIWGGSDAATNFGFIGHSEEMNLLSRIAANVAWSVEGAFNTPAFNKAQTVLLNTFSKGEFAYILNLSTEAELVAELDKCGNGLLRYLMVELSTAEGCVELETAEDRIQSSINGLMELAGHLTAERVWNSQRSA